MSKKLFLFGRLFQFWPFTTAQNAYLKGHVCKKTTVREPRISLTYLQNANISYPHNVSHRIRIQPPPCPSRSPPPSTPPRSPRATPPPAPKAEAPANEFSWDSAPSAARQSAPSAAPAARRQAVDLDNVDPDFAPRTNSGYSAPAASYNPTPTSNVVSFGARKQQPVDYDNIDPDFAPKRELVGAASSGYSAPAAASFGGASAAPTKVERRGGVMYDPDQYDSENASRFGRR